jgi:hypothetical protein
MNAALDHLVVIAASLDEGVAWCEHTLGVCPGPGGEHPLMGTHNRLLRIDGPGFERAYLEIIAIQPAVRPLRQPPLRRWFDMDDAHLMHAVRTQGPQLRHWVARTNALPAALQACQRWGWDRGPALAASRMSPQGLLQWHISVRDDGQRLLDGTLPTLIAWGDVHPVDAMPASPVRLAHLRVQHPEHRALQAWAQAIGLHGIEWTEGPPALQAQLHTPRGRVDLRSPA